MAKIEKIYLGTTEVDKLLAGTDLVYERNEPDTTPPITTVYPDPTTQTYDAGTKFWLEVNEACTTYYTLDGSTPTTESSIFTDAFVFDADTTIKYFSVDLAGNTETVKTSTVNINEPTSGGWRYLRITPDSMNGHWQGCEIQFMEGTTNRALASTGALVPASDGANTFGTYGALINGDTTTAGVYYTWGYPLRIDADLGASYPIDAMNIYLGNSTTNKTTPATVQVSTNNVDWIDGKVTYVNNPSTLQQAYTISV